MGPVEDLRGVDVVVNGPVDLGPGRVGKEVQFGVEEAGKELPSPGGGPLVRRVVQGQEIRRPGGPEGACGK